MESCSKYIPTQGQKRKDIILQALLNDELETVAREFCKIYESDYECSESCPLENRCWHNHTGFVDWINDDAPIDYIALMQEKLKKEDMYEEKNY